MESAENWQQRGVEYEERGDYGKAIESFYKALENHQTDLQLWTQFAQSFRYVQFSNYDVRLHKALFLCLDKQIGNYQDVVNASVSLLKLMPPFHHLLQIVEQGDREKVKSLIRSGEVFQIVNDPLFLSLLKKTIVTDPQVEKLLTVLRREFLDAFIDKQLPVEQEEVELFIEALAMQCFQNQYVYMDSRSEVEKREVLTSLDRLGREENIRLALMSCYRPLEPFTKNQSKITAVTSVKDEVSKKVKEQYETHPYPSWSNVAIVEPQTLNQYLKNALPHVKQSDHPFSDHPKILIAGCGTGQHALNTAIQIINAEVLGLDLSLNSLIYAQEKANELKIRNVEFIQGDILEFAPKEKFDLIECVGVLHHMKDPFQGWVCLKGMLKPQGVMQVGLYSELGRQDVIAARELIREWGFGSGDEEIRQSRQRLLNLPKDSLAKNVTRSIDFYSLAGCRDLLFHVQEHRFDLLQIKKMIEGLDFEFLGFSFRDKNIKKQYLRQHPEDPLGVSLECWHEFEQQNSFIFAGMYQFWVRFRSQL